MSDHPHRELSAWVQRSGLHESVLSSGDLPPDPTTLRQSSDRWCEAEGITDPVQQEKRWKTVQRWPRLYAETFPEPAISRPRGQGRGRPAAIFSQAKLDEWLVEDGPHAQETKPANLERLASMTVPMTLPKIAEVLGVRPRTVVYAREASLKRIKAGKAGPIEIPDPVAGTHDDYGVEYEPKDFARFWKMGRPGRARRHRTIE